MCCVSVPPLEFMPCPLANEAGGLHLATLVRPHPAHCQWLLEGLPGRALGELWAVCRPTLPTGGPGRHPNKPGPMRGTAPWANACCQQEWRLRRSCQWRGGLTVPRQPRRWGPPEQARHSELLGRNRSSTHFEMCAQKSSEWMVRQGGDLSALFRPPPTAAAQA
jgi:hypothetical protein